VSGFLSGLFSSEMDQKMRKLGKVGVRFFPSGFSRQKRIKKDEKWEKWVSDFFSKQRYKKMSFCRSAGFLSLPYLFCLTAIQARNSIKEPWHRSGKDCRVRYGHGMKGFHPRVSGSV